MRLLLCLVTLGLVGCGGASSDWDPASASTLKADIESMFTDLDAGNFDGMLAKIEQDGISFDFDENMAPVTIHNLDEMKAYFAKFKEMMTAQSMVMKSSILSNECRATSVMGFCAMEFDQTMSMGGKEIGPTKFRATLVARKVGDAWQWTHWHSSFREMPSMEMMAPPAGASAAPTDPTATPATR